MSKETSAQLLYCWGWWAWYYRFIALIVYAAALLLLGFYFPARDLLRRLSFGNLLLLVLVALIVGAWMFVVRATWRDGQSRVTRIALLPERDALLVNTLNFGSRRIPRSALENFRLQNLQPDSAEDHEPTLTVQVRGERPLRIDLEGRILDKQMFNTIFHLPKGEVKGRDRG